MTKGIDLYTKIVLTVIAVCLICIVTKDMNIVPDAKAQYSSTGIESTVNSIGDAIGIGPPYGFCYPDTLYKAVDSIRSDVKSIQSTVLMIDSSVLMIHNTVDKELGRYSYKFGSIKSTVKSIENKIESIESKMGR